MTNQLNLLAEDLEIARREFNFLLQAGQASYIPSVKTLKMDVQVYLLDTVGVTAENPMVKLAMHRYDAAGFAWKTEQARLLPEFKVGYNNQSLIGVQQIAGREQYFNSGKRFSYVTVGVGIPVFSKASNSRIAAAKTEWERSRTEAEYAAQQTATSLANSVRNVQKYLHSLHYYESQALKNADLILTTADGQFNAGVIDYLQWVILADQAITIKAEYLSAIDAYNQAAIALTKLNNQ